MKYFKTTGIGNYSECHNWDNGIQLAVGEELSAELIGETLNDDLPVGFKMRESGVYLDFTTYGGTRNACGITAAPSYEGACEMVEEYEKGFNSVQSY